MNRIFGFVLFAALFFSFGCRPKNHFYNTAKENYERAVEAKDSGNNIRALVKMCESNEFWEEYYGYVYLNELFSRRAFQSKELVAVFVDGLFSDHDEIRQTSAKALREASPEFLGDVASIIISLVEKGENDSSAWYLTEAVGNIENATDRQNASKALVACIRLRKDDVVPLGALNVKIFAAQSLAKIGANDADSIQALTELLDSGNFEIVLAAAEALQVLGVSNSQARKKLKKLSEVDGLIGERATLILKRTENENEE